MKENLNNTLINNSAYSNHKQLRIGLHFITLATIGQTQNLYIGDRYLLTEMSEPVNEHNVIHCNVTFWCLLTFSAV